MSILRDFVKSGLLDAVGNMPKYWVKLNAAGWVDKGVLTTEDLAEIEKAIGDPSDDWMESSKEEDEKIQAEREELVHE